MNPTEDNWALYLRLSFSSLSRTIQHQILKHHSTWSHFLGSRAHELHASYISPNAQSALQAIPQSTLDSALHWLTQETHSLMSFQEENYPDCLRHIPDPPPLLYCQGNPTALKQPQLAIVGSRNPSRPGKEHAYRFAYEASELGLTVTSGLAIGIDTQAHEGALAAQAPTVAVLGCGLYHCYPKRNQALLKRITEQGCVISEFPLQAPPRAAYFPQRNRLISGLSLGVLVVEAHARSGSLITARCALEQGREVFALPGSLNNPLSKGCHLLIQQGAKLVECLQDMVVELPPLQVRGPTSPVSFKENLIQNNQSALDRSQRKLLECLGYEPTGLDALLARSQLPMIIVTRALLELELAGLVIVEQGRYYRK